MKSPTAKGTSSLWNPIKLSGFQGENFPLAAGGMTLSDPVQARPTPIQVQSQFVLEA